MSSGVNYISHSPFLIFAFTHLGLVARCGIGTFDRIDYTPFNGKIELAAPEPTQAAMKERQPGGKGNLPRGEGGGWLVVLVCLKKSYGFAENVSNRSAMVRMTF